MNGSRQDLEVRLPFLVALCILTASCASAPPTAPTLKEDDLTDDRLIRMVLNEYTRSETIIHQILRTGNLALEKDCPYTDADLDTTEDYLKEEFPKAIAGSKTASDGYQVDALIEELIDTNAECTDLAGIPNGRGFRFVSRFDNTKTRGTDFDNPMTSVSLPALDFEQKLLLISIETDRGEKKEPSALYVLYRIEGYRVSKVAEVPAPN